MNWIDHITTLPNPIKLASFFVDHIFIGAMQPIFIDAALILTIHGFYIFLLIRAFKRYVINTSIAYNAKASILFYSVMILLIILSHVCDIFIFTWVLEALKVFPDTLMTFMFVSGMYTTIGSSYTPGPQWESLSIVISFTGLFAFSISGSGLYSMLAYFIDSSKRNTDAKS
jgi:hypothetical protein